MDPIGIFVAIVISSLAYNVDKLNNELHILSSDSVYIMQEIEALKDENKRLNDDFNGLFADYLKLGSSHAAISARDITYIESLKEQLKNLEERLENNQNRIDYLDNKIQIIHP